jgi:hypothetical protein
VVVAAARLAALYAILVVLMLVALALWTGEWIGLVSEIGQLYLVTFAFVFAVAFLLLATARRAGLVAIWLLLIGSWNWWVWPLGRSSWLPDAVFPLFILWSVVALPFYVLGSVAIPAKPLLRVGRLAVAAPMIVLGGWVMLIVLTFAVTPPEWLFYVSAIDGLFGGPPPVVLRLAPLIWWPAPIVLGAQALVHVWPRRSWADRVVLVWSPAARGAPSDCWSVIRSDRATRSGV